MLLRTAPVTEDAERGLAAVPELHRRIARPHAVRVTVLVTAPLPAGERTHPGCVAVQVAPRDDPPARHVADLEPTLVPNDVVEVDLRERVAEELRFAPRSQEAALGAGPRGEIRGRKLRVQVRWGRRRRRRRWRLRRVVLV